MEVAMTLPARTRSPGRFTFVQKPVAAAGLIAIADMLFYYQRVGSTLGLFSLSLLAFVLICRPEIARDRAALLAAMAAAVLGLVLVEDPTAAGAALFWLATTLAVLLPKTARFDDGWRWTRRLALHTVHSLVAPFADLRRGRRASRRRPIGFGRNLPVLVVPVLGSLLFLSLFAVANPLIGNAFGSIEFADWFGGLYPSRILFWLVALIPIWALLRPRLKALAIGNGPGEAQASIPGISIASVTLSLVAFNALFGLQNALDLAFLWSGTALPEGVTLAEYAHRGAYPLIATALLAGLFVLVTLRPGSETAESPLIRKLVYVWIGQNIFLVASTMLRTLDYIEAYSLTRLRIAALIWMGLVALGLALICYRIWKRKSAGWLINANLAAALLVLGACSVVDLGRMAAAWNVRHAREAGGRGTNLDICYLAQLGPSALLPLIELEGRTANPILKQRGDGCGLVQCTGSPKRRRIGTAGRSAALAGWGPLARPSSSAGCRWLMAGGVTARPGAATGFDSASGSVTDMYDMSHKILIVDDDPHIREVLMFALGKAGMETAQAGDGEAALAEIEARRPDLVVLDINMPRMDGLEVCRRLRASGDLPILFLSSRDDEVDRVVGLELGGDDYVVKPFSPREVVARVSAILKRGGRALEQAGTSREIAHGKLSLDTEAWEARWEGQQVPVTVTEFQLLLLLASLPSKVFSRDAIIDRLHGPGFAVTDRTVDSHIRNVRHKFAAVGAGDLIETRAGVGYRIGPCLGGGA